MKSKERIEIKTETIREITLRLERRAGRSFFSEKCGSCSANLLTLNEAVQFSGIVWDKIIRFVENGNIHSVETAQGEFYVCIESLLRFKNQEN